VAKEFDGINNSLRDFLLAQPLFFVATAPSGSGGHVNLSPKGIDGTFAVIDERTVAYLDLTGSGVETIAHLKDNGRLEGQRPLLPQWAERKGPEGIAEYHGTTNAASIDGLPGVAR
jgi:hypothetical protein